MSLSGVSSNCSKTPTTLGGSRGATRPAGGSPLLSGFALWRDAIQRLSVALLRYVEEIRDTGSKILGVGWNEAVQSLSQLEHGLNAVRLEQSMSLADAMGLADTLEIASTKMVALAAYILNENVRMAVVTGLSRTFSENISGLFSGVNDALLAVEHAQRVTMTAARGLGGDETLWSDFQSHADEIGGISFSADKPWGGIAAELYVNALLHRRSAADISALEIAKYSALGIAADTLEAAKADALRFGRGHPAAAMCYVPIYSSSNDRGAGASAGTSMPPFPSARLNISYDIGPLISRERALSFGPIAAMTSGLNYRLVERLRTITGHPVSKVGFDRDSTELATRAPIAAGNDLVARPQTDGTWVPLGGANPRVEAYSDIMTTIILDRIRRDAWPADIVERYEVAIANEEVSPGETLPENVVRVLGEEFAKCYDASPPNDLTEYRDMVVPELVGAKCYISRAVARLVEEGIRVRLREFLTNQAKKGGSANTSHYVEFEREIRVSAAILVNDVTRSLWRRIKEAYKPDTTLFDHGSSVRRREIHLKHFRAVAATAVAVGAVYCSPPSLKAFAASPLH
jgi:hypothetical protein